VHSWQANGLDHAKRRLIVFFQHAANADIAELTRLAKTVDRWRHEILAFHTTGGASNGPTEAVNLIIEKSPIPGVDRPRRRHRCAGGGRLGALLVFDLGLGLATPSVLTAGIEAAPNSRVGPALGVLAARRYVGSIFASVLFGVLIADSGALSVPRRPLIRSAGLAAGDSGSPGGTREQ